ncbi:TolC family protein [Aeoliella sp. SH292]|uniref:TolC family protein n=1 Tax=Aeoliella sp. SH292 TaxID=3454464 RepID=UPI003F9DB33F
MISLTSPAVQGQVRPMVPPLDCCENQYDPCCPSRAANCIPLPTVHVPDDQAYLDPSTAPRNAMSVYEAINIALSNSEVVRNLGLVDANSDNDIIRGEITTYDPMIAAAEADAQWGIFDPMWTTNMYWNRQDIPPGTSFSGIGNRPPQLDNADFITSLDQLLPGGTRFGVDGVVDYLFNPQNPVSLDPNPQYFSYTQFRVNQPLLRNLGMDVTMANIRIVSAEAERTDWRFKQEVLALVRSVETAFWALHAEEKNLRAIDEVLPLYREVVRIRSERGASDAGTAAEVARAKAEMYRLEQVRLEIISRVNEFQIVLRNLIGVNPADGDYLTTIAITTLAPPVESVESAVYTALRQRPDVLRQRLAVYVAQQEEVLAENSLKPLLDFNAFWRLNGLGNELGNSLEMQSADDYRDWEMGLTFQVPLGRREAKAKVRSRQLNIMRERSLLDQVAHQASFEVVDAHRRMVWDYRQYGVAQDRVDALRTYGEAAKAQYDTPPAGMSPAFALELYLDNLREYLDAVYRVNNIVSDYYSAQARYEEVKGTLLARRLVEIEGDGTLQVPEEVLAPESIQPAPAPAPAAEPQAQIPATPQQPLSQAPPARPATPTVQPEQLYNLPLDPVVQHPAATPEPSAVSLPSVSPEVAAVPVPVASGSRSSSSSAPVPFAPVPIQPERAPVAATTPVETFNEDFLQPMDEAWPSVDLPQAVVEAPAAQPEARESVEVPTISQPSLVLNDPRQTLAPAPRNVAGPTAQVRPYVPAPAPQLAAPALQPIPAMPQIEVNVLDQPRMAIPPTATVSESPAPVVAPQPVASEVKLVQPAPIRWQPLAQQPVAKQQLGFGLSDQLQASPEMQQFEVQQVPSQPVRAAMVPVTAESIPNFQVQQSVAQPTPMSAAASPLATHHPLLSNPLALVPGDRYTAGRWQPLESLPAQVAQVPDFQVAQPISATPREVQQVVVPFVAVLQPMALEPAAMPITMPAIEATPIAAGVLQQPTMQPARHEIARESLSQPTFVR